MDICEIGLLKDRNNRVKLYGYIKDDMTNLKKFMAGYLKLYVAFLVAIAVILSISLGFEFFFAYAVNLIFEVGYTNAAYTILPFTVIVIAMLAIVLYKSLNYFDKLKR